MKKRIINVFVILCCFIQGCSSAPNEPRASMQEIKGRDPAHRRIPVYRAKVPNHWIRHDPLPDEPLEDTTKAICEFIIKEKEGLIRIAIHSFPSNSIEERISSESQVSRWQRQLTWLMPTDYVITQFAGNGYLGLFFKGKGLQKKKPIQIMAWSLLIAPEHYRTLVNSKHFANKSTDMRADITIKAVGHPQLFARHEEEIIYFAKSFELIDEIPTKS